VIRRKKKSINHFNIMITGCPAFGCGPYLQFKSALDLPPLSSFKLASVFTSSAIDCLVISSSNPGCISSASGSQLTCRVQASCESSSNDTATGLISFLSSNLSSPFYSYDGQGSSWCIRNSSLFVSNLPIMNGAGDIITYDVDGVVYLLSNGTSAWQRSIVPAPLPCPFPLPSISITNHTDLVFVVPSTSQVFEYLGDGIPQAEIRLFGNNSGAQYWPPPPTFSPFSVYPSSGLFVPISTPATIGERLILIARFYETNNSSDTLATSSIYMLGIDQRNVAVGRVWWAFQYPLNISICSDTVGSASPLYDPLRITGPIGLYSDNSLVFGISCSSALSLELFRFDVILDSLPRLVLSSSIEKPSSNAYAAYFTGPLQDKFIYTFWNNVTNATVSAIDVDSGVSVQSIIATSLFSEPTTPPYLFDKNSLSSPKMLVGMTSDITTSESYLVSFSVSASINISVDSYVEVTNSSYPVSGQLGLLVYENSTIIAASSGPSILFYST
jgi:hypothetical protein